tara:strand:- start:2531 stop:2692 length:162 start_codon:yes stop_codon:yes gene_type:complete
LKIYNNKLALFYIKKGQATYITPLRPSILATFRSWGVLMGAGCIRLAQYEISN